MRIGLIINRRSGQGIDKSIVERTIQECERYDMDVVVSESFGNDLETSFDHVASHHPDALVVGGGDGTLSAIATKLAGSTMPIGILPLGTSNHFAKDLKLPESIEDCIEVIARGEPSVVDVAEVNGRIFINNSSIGVYPLAVVLRKNYEKKFGWNKRFAMFRAMFRVFRQFPMFTVKLDTDKGEYFQKTSFVFVGNNEYIAGSRATLTDGLLSVYTAHMKGRWGILLMGLLNLVGRLGEKYFDRHLVKELELDTTKKKMIVSVDGEVYEMEPPLRYTIKPRALHVLLPAKAVE
jgi:diacylglycerol kinase family enzyme